MIEQSTDPDLWTGDQPASWADDPDPGSVDSYDYGDAQQPEQSGWLDAPSDAAAWVWNGWANVGELISDQTSDAAAWVSTGWGNAGRALAEGASDAAAWTVDGWTAVFERTLDAAPDTVGVQITPGAVIAAAAIGAGALLILDQLLLRGTATAALARRVTG